MRRASSLSMISLGCPLSTNSTLFVAGLGDWLDDLLGVVDCLGVSQQPVRLWRDVEHVAACGDLDHAATIPNYHLGLGRSAAAQFFDCRNQAYDARHIVVSACQSSPT